MGQKNTKHILLIEDSPDLQMLLAQLFKSEGYQVSQAYDGREALQFLRSGQPFPSLILLDVMMPVMDGIEFRQEQKNDPNLVKIPVIFMSADSNSQARTNLLGVSEFIRKPITDIDKLLDTVERFRLRD